MGDPTYDAIRARERAEAEKMKAADDLVKMALTAFTDFFNGRARLLISPPSISTDGIWEISFKRHPPAS